MIEIATFYEKIDRETERLEKYIRNKLELLKEIFAREERIRDKGFNRVESLLNSSSRSINNEIRDFKTFRNGWKKAFMDKNFRDIVESLNRQGYEAEKENETLGELREILNVIKGEIDGIDDKLKKFAKYNKKEYKTLKNMKKGFEV